MLDSGTEQAELPGDTRPTTSQTDREERLTTLLDALSKRLGTGDAQALAAPAGAQQLAAVDGNVGRIGFRSLDLRYVAPAELSGDQLSSPDTWVAGVEVGWQFRRYDASPSSLEVPMVVADDGSTARFAGISAGVDKSRVPLWLLERLAVRKSDRTLVLAADRGRLTRLHRLARHAVPAVDRVLPDWRGFLVLEGPSTQALLDRAVGSDPATTGKLAGITTTVDGSLTRGVATHVLLNPAVFDALGPQAAQIVVTHEATHVATDGAVSAMPQWLLEGFADYVALRDSDLPVSVSASQILREVRSNGPPRRLPVSADFSGESHGLGTAYEAAWLACRLLAEEYGERRLVEFYRRSDVDGSTRRALRTVLGTTEAAFTRSWSSYLARLASAS